MAQSQEFDLLALRGFLCDLCSNQGTDILTPNPKIHDGPRRRGGDGGREAEARSRDDKVSNMHPLIHPAHVHAFPHYTTSTSKFMRFPRPVDMDGEPSAVAPCCWAV
jgi:hypothetical protein